MDLLDFCNQSASQLRAPAQNLHRVPFIEKKVVGFWAAMESLRDRVSQFGGALVESLLHITASDETTEIAAQRPFHYNVAVLAEAIAEAKYVYIMLMASRSDLSESDQVAIENAHQAAAQLAVLLAKLNAPVQSAQNGDHRLFKLVAGTPVFLMLKEHDSPVAASAGACEQVPEPLQQQVWALVTARTNRCCQYQAVVKKFRPFLYESASPLVAAYEGKFPSFAFGNIDESAAASAAWF